MMKAMYAEGLEWTQDYWSAVRRAVHTIPEDQMAQMIDCHLDERVVARPIPGSSPGTATAATPPS